MRGLRRTMPAAIVAIAWTERARRPGGAGWRGWLAVRASGVKNAVSLVAKLQLRDPSAEALLPDALRRQQWRGAYGCGASERNGARGSPVPEGVLGKQSFPAGVAKQEIRDEETTGGAELRPQALSVSRR